MKRVLLIAQNFYPEIGSAANRIKNIYMELQDKGYDVTVLTTEPNYPNRNLYKNPIFFDEPGMEENVIRIETKTRKYTNNVFRRLLLYLEITLRFIMIICNLKGRYHYVFVSTPPIFIGIAGLFAKKRLKAKLILDVRDLWPESLLGVGIFTNPLILLIAYALEKVLYRSAHRIIINSEGFSSYIVSKGIDVSRISFMPNSLTEKEMLAPPVYPDASEKITVIYTGNIGLAQDIVKFIEIAEYLREYKKITFKIIGYGFRRQEVEQFVIEKGLSNIEFISAKSRKETLKEVSLAHIAYVSLVEKDVFKTVLPGKIIDYMGMRKPIVGDVDGYAHYILEQAACGLTAADRSVETLARHIITFAEDEDLRKCYGDNGHHYAFCNLNWSKNIEVLTDILEEKDVKESLYVRMESFHQ